MHMPESIHCLNCLQTTPVSAVDDQGICGHCRELRGRAGLDLEGQPLGADGGVHIEEFHTGGNALLDEREFDGGETLAACDEI